jgi:hypothetical protein
VREVDGLSYEEIAHSWRCDRHREVALTAGARAVGTGEVTSL